MGKGGDTMKKSILVLAAILSLGAITAETALQLTPAAYAAASPLDSQGDQPDNNANDGQGSKTNDGHSGHHG